MSKLCLNLSKPLSKPPRQETDDLDRRFQVAFSQQHGYQPGPPMIEGATLAAAEDASSWRARWAAAPFGTQLAAVLILGFVLPWAILVGGVIGLAAWDALARLAAG